MLKTGLKIAAGVGGAMYLSNEMGEENAKIQQCTSDCLPLNYDELAYGDLSKSDLEYATTEPTDDQPVCSEEIEEDCGEYCSNTCKDIHKTSLFDKVSDAAGPLGGVIDAAGDVAGEVTGAFTDVAASALDEAFEAAGFPHFWSRWFTRKVCNLFQNWSRCMLLLMHRIHFVHVFLA